MFCKFRQQCLLSYSFNRYIHKYIFKMDRAYLRHMDDNEMFELSFKYINEELKVQRQFNFSRQLSETLGSFLSRISTNVEKVVNKKSKKKRKEEDNKPDQNNVVATLLLNNEDPSSDLKCVDIFQPGNNVVLRLMDAKYHIIINSPWIHSFALPSSIMANFPVYPSKFGTIFTDKNLSEFVWAKSQDKKNWTEISNKFMYTPTNEDIDFYLKLTCTPKNCEAEGPTVEIISDCQVEASPGECPFEVRHKFTQTTVEGKEFRVVSYNILADLYCDSDYTREVLHPYCPPYALNIDYRKQLILKEIIGYNADLICLQEVDKKVYVNDLNPLLTHLGYSSEFATKGGEVIEGLACFWNNNRFQLLNSYRLVFSEHIDKDPRFAEVWEKISTNCKLSERILARTTTLHTNILQSKEHNEILVVANTHLYFHPDADHIRLLHSGLAIKYLEDIVSNVKNDHVGKRVSLIFCGDFNSVPQCGIYKLFTTGFVPKDFIDYRSNIEEAVTGVELKQSFLLGSACGTPKYTNYTTGFADCLDYIFYEMPNLEVTQVVPMPSHEEVTEHTALPSILFPSDHIALVSDLKFL